MPLHDRPDGLAERQMPFDSASPRLARRFVSEVLAEQSRPDALEVATLLVSELVTNAALHTGGDCGAVRVRSRGGIVRVEVVDPSPRAPVVRARNVQAEGGRGMLLVEELADAWGVEVHERGKTVWFEVGDAGFGPDGGSLDRAFTNVFPGVLRERSALAGVLRGGDGVLLRDLPTGDPGPAPLSAVVVPLRARRRMLGAIVWMTTERSQRRYDGARWSSRRTSPVERASPWTTPASTPVSTSSRSSCSAASFPRSRPSPVSSSRSATSPAASTPTSEGTGTTPCPCPAVASHWRSAT